MIVMVTRRSVYLLGLLLILSGILLACGSGIDDGEGTLSGRTAAQGLSDVDGVEIEGGDGPFFSLISIIPDTKYNRYGVIVDDFARVRELVGIPPPDDFAEDDALLRYLNSITNMEGLVSGGSPWISGYNYQAHAFLKNREHLAFSFLNVDQSAMTTVRPNVFEVVKGRFNPFSTENALERCDECPSPRKIEHRGIEFYSWSEVSPGRMDRRLTPPIFDQLGQGGQLAVFDSYAFRTIESVDMKLLLDANQGLVPSLADHPDFARVAKEMDGLGIYSGGIVFDADTLRHAYMPSSVLQDEEAFCLNSSMGVECWETLFGHFEQGMILEEYNVIAVGGGHDKNGYFMSIVFVHGNENQAARNAKTFKRIWEEGVDFRTGDLWKDVFLREPNIETDGRLVKVSLATSSSPTWAELLYDKNSMLWHK